MATVTWRNVSVHIFRSAFQHHITGVCLCFSVESQSYFSWNLQKSLFSKVWKSTLFSFFGGGWKSESVFISPSVFFYSGPWVEHTRAGVVGDGVAAVDLTLLSAWGCVCGSFTELWVLSTFAECVFTPSVSFSISRWGGTYPVWGFECSLWCWLLGDFGGQRPLLSCPRKPLSLGLQCSRHWRARVERSATRRLSSGPQPRSPSSAPIRR